VNIVVFQKLYYAKYETIYMHQYISSKIVYMEAQFFLYRSQQKNVHCYNIGRTIASHCRKSAIVNKSFDENSKSHTRF